MKTRNSFLEKQHDDILERLKRESVKEGLAGQTFKDIIKILEYHLERERDTVLPLVEYLMERVGGNPKSDYESLLAASKAFDAQYDNMIREHHQILKLIDGIYDEITTNDDDVFELVHALKNLISIEEQIAYPAAIAAGDLVEMESRPKIRS